MELSKLQCMRKLTLWESLFPIHFNQVLHILGVIVDEVDDLGLKLGAPLEFIQSLRADFPSDVKQRRRELVRWWMSSSPNPPCWWHLVQALRRIDRGALAEDVRKEHGESYVPSLCFCAVGFTEHSLPLQVSTSSCKRRCWTKRLKPSSQMWTSCRHSLVWWGPGGHLWP